MLSHNIYHQYTILVVVNSSIRTIIYLILEIPDHVLLCGHIIHSRKILYGKIVIVVERICRAGVCRTDAD